MGIFNTAHKFYNEFYDDEGNFKDYDWLIEKGAGDNKKDKGSIAFYVHAKDDDKINRKRLDYIKKFYEVTFENIKGNDLVEYHLTHLFSVRNNITNYIKDVEPELNFDTAKTRIINTTGKINRQFKFEYEYKINGKNIKPEKWDAIETIIKLKCINEDVYMPILKQCFKEIDDYCIHSRENTIVKNEFKGIKINSSVKYDKNNKPETEEFKNFIEVIRPYSKPQVTAAQSYIDSLPNFIAYLNYLVNPTIIKEDSEKELSNDVRRMLGLNELYITNMNDVFKDM